MLESKNKECSHEGVRLALCRHEPRQQEPASARGEQAVAAPPRPAAAKSPSRGVRLRQAPSTASSTSCRTLPCQQCQELFSCRKQPSWCLRRPPDGLPGSAGSGPGTSDARTPWCRRGDVDAFTVENFTVFNCKVWRRTSATAPGPASPTPGETS